MSLPINWFDVLLIVVAVAGIFRGRKRGMSEELLTLLAWLTVLIGCALTYAPVGKLLADTLSWTMLNCYLIAYVVIWLVIIGSFALLKRALGGKLIGSDIFGKSEYYLGMMSGMIRFLCCLLAFMALLNARLFPRAEVLAWEKNQKDIYGSTFFPGLHSLQSGVFEQSLTGPWIKENLDFLLIKPTLPENNKFKQREWQGP
jgi:uncharacterized membrane protein required for colicin V production